MTGNEEMLASVSVNGYTRKASHIMSGATMSTVNEGGRTYVSSVHRASISRAEADRLLSIDLISVDTAVEN